MLCDEVFQPKFLTPAIRSSRSSNEDCQAQLSDVRYRELLNGKIEIEHKDEARRGGVKQFLLPMFSRADNGRGEIPAAKPLV